MADESFLVVFEGKIKEGFNPEEVESRLAVLFRLSPERARSLMGKPVVVKRGLGLAVAEQYKKALELIGCLCRIEPDATAEVSQPPMEMEKEEEPRASAPCPKCGHQRPEDHTGNDDECPKCGLIISKYLAMREEEAKISPVGPGPESNTNDPAKTLTIEFPGAESLHSILQLDSTLLISMDVPAEGLPVLQAFSKQRSCAGLASWAHWTFVSFLIQIPVAIVLLLAAMAGFQLPFNSADYGGLGSMCSLLAAGYSFLYLPLQWHGLTYGQRLMGIWVARRDGSPGNPSFSRVLLRAVGSLINVFTLGIVNWFIKGASGGRGLPDVLTGTVQLDTGTMPEHPQRTALKPWGYAMCGFLAFMLVLLPIRYFFSKDARRQLPTRPVAAQPSSRITASELLGESQPRNRQSPLSTTMSPEEVLNKLAAMQKKYYEDHRKYSNDLEALLQMYGRDFFPVSDPLYSMPYSNHLMMTATNESFDIRLMRGKKWYAVTDFSYLGERPAMSDAESRGRRVGTKKAGKP